MDMESILLSTKEMLGPSAEDPHFEPEIITHINTVFMDLNQMGVGPEDGFIIEDETTVWTDYIPNVKKLAAVKTYMYLRVRLLFDPPASATIVETINREIGRYEWRITHAVEFTET